MLFRVRARNVRDAVDALFTRRFDIRRIDQSMESQSSAAVRKNNKDKLRMHLPNRVSENQSLKREDKRCIQQDCYQPRPRRNKHLQ